MLSEHNCSQCPALAKANIALEAAWNIMQRVPGSTEPYKGNHFFDSAHATFS